jgi:hypothetical protein
MMFFDLYNVYVINIIMLVSTGLGVVGRLGANKTDNLSVPT